MNIIVLDDLDQRVTQLNQRLSYAYNQFKQKADPYDLIQSFKDIIQKSDSKDEQFLSTSLLLIALSYYQVNDFHAAYTIPHFLLSLYRLDSQFQFQLQWIIIKALEKDCKYQTALDYIQSLLPSIQSTTGLYTILNKKKQILVDFINNKYSKLQAMTEEERFSHAQDLSKMLQRQNDSKYFDSEGFFGYFVCANWLNRWKVFSQFYKLNNENLEQIKAQVIKKKNLMEDENSTVVNFLADLNLLNRDQIELQINETQNYDYFIQPIFNDDLIIPNYPIIQDTQSVKEYCNYKLINSTILFILQYLQDIKEDQDYYILASYSYKYLKDHFGAIEVKRINNSINDDDDSIFYIETHPKIIQFQIYPKVKDQQTYSLQINKKETVTDLIEKINRILDIKINKIWKPLDKKALEQFLQMTPQDKVVQIQGDQLNPRYSLENSEISDNDMLIAEVFNGDIIIKQKKKKKEINEDIPNICGSCGNKSGKLYYCECYHIKYCNQICQQKDRKKHQDECKKIVNKEKYLITQAKRFKIRPPSKFRDDSRRGLCGLQNLGNTCFMSTSIQGLSTVYELTNYLITNQFLNDINEKNPLGSGGKLVSAYADLMKDMWEGSKPYLSPWYLKNVIGKFAPQFSGYSQQDSQELLSYLLDGIHEDLNMIRNKPYIAEVVYNNQEDEELAEIYWQNHTSRNKSIITNLFTGQFKSKVQCPDCNNISITFDPFITLSLPIPNKEYINFTFYLIFRNSAKIPIKILLCMLAETTTNEIIDYVQSKTQVDTKTLQFFHLVNNKIEKPIIKVHTIKELKDMNGIIFLYEMYDPTIDFPTPKYDAELAKGNKADIQLQVNISESKTKYGFSSYGRIMRINYNQTYSEIHLQIYRFFRTHFMLYLQSAQLDGESKKFFTSLYGEKFEILEKISIEKLEEEYEGLIKENKQPFKIEINTNKYLPYSKTDSLEKEYNLDTSKQKTIELTLIVNNTIKLEALRMNRCVDSDFNIEAQNAQNSCNIYDCLNYFCKEEILGVGDEWYCNRCKQHKRASKKMEIYKAPTILIIHLKRFKTQRVYNFGNYFFQGGSSKINAFIDYPLKNLDLNSNMLIKKKKNIDVDYRYDLFAVSNHYGGLGGGHYTAYTLNPITNKWYDFNDSSVYPVRDDQAVTDSAYVLFYRRKDSEICQLK